MEIPRTILILAANPRALVPAEQFLVNRGWLVTTTTDERVALSSLIERRPSFFMISMEHPNKKVRHLYRLLKQSHPELCVLLFGETNNLETYRLLSQTDHANKVPPPITGPAIERAVSRFLKESAERRLREELYSRSMKIPRPEDRLVAGLRPERDESRQIDGEVAGADAPVSLSDLGMPDLFDEFVVKSGPPRETLPEIVSNTACIVVESSRFSGYLIAAMAGNRSFDESFIALIRDRLTAFLRQNGETVQEGESFPLEIREVRFEAWAADYAEFLKKTVHEGQEIAFAFFPMTEVTPDIGESVKENMVTVKLSDIAADIDVDFNLYLHLPANDRFFLYTPKGSALFADQKERLLRGGIRELHLRRDDVPAFKRYRTRQKVDSMILDFEERQALR